MKFHLSAKFPFAHGHPRQHITIAGAEYPAAYIHTPLFPWHVTFPRAALVKQRRNRVVDLPTNNLLARTVPGFERRTATKREAKDVPPKRLMI